MASLPKLPENKNQDLPPFLNEGKSKVEFIEGRVVDGPPNNPIPAVVMNLKVLESTNPMNFAGQVHTVRITCIGFSWGDQLQNIVSAAGLLPKKALNQQTIEALFASGKLAGRKFEIEQKSVSGFSKKQQKEVSWREYSAVPLETTPCIQL
jgi:hypothetical protein